MVYVTPVRCFWGVQGTPSCGGRACCARGARRPGVVWVPARACTGSLCGRARGRLRRRLPALLVVALTLARGFVPRDMRGLGAGSRTRLPLRPVPRIRRIIPQASSGIRAGGAAPAPVIGAPPLPARPGG